MYRTPIILVLVVSCISSADASFAGDDVTQRIFDRADRAWAKIQKFQQLSAPKSYYVLAVGVEHYRDLPPAAGGAHDAQSLVETLEPVESIFTNPDRQGFTVRKNVLLDRQATGKAIVSALNELRDATKPDDCVVVFLSGHGDRSRGHWLFAPHDYNPLEPDATAVQDSIILTALQPLLERGQKVLLALNSCHAGQILVTAEKLGCLNSWRSGGGLILIASCASSEVSIGTPTRTGNGFFTKNFLHALDCCYRAERGITPCALRHQLRQSHYDFADEDEFRHGYPGFPLQDQACVFEYSDSISPDIPILPPPHINLAWENPGHGLGLKDTELTARLKRETVVAGNGDDHRLVGTWAFRKLFVSSDGSRLVDKQGNPRKEEYVLDLNKNGYYVVQLTDLMGNVEVHSGRFLYTQQGTFVLDFGSGYVTPQISSLSDNQLTIACDAQKRYLILDRVKASVIP
jgi:Caspase domain